MRIENGKQMVEEIDRQDGWTSKRASFYAELVDLNMQSQVGYVPSKLASQMVDDDWAAQKQIMPMRTELTVIAVEANPEAEHGHVAETPATVDWNSVELNDPTDLVIAPMPDIEMAELFGIPVDKEQMGEANANTELCEDVDGELMEEAADDVDDARGDELLHVYDRENPIIEVGKLWPNMDDLGCVSRHMQ